MMATVIRIPRKQYKKIRNRIIFIAVWIVIIAGIFFLANLKTEQPTTVVNQAPAVQPPQSSDNSDPIGNFFSDLFSPDNSTTSNQTVSTDNSSSSSSTGIFGNFFFDIILGIFGFIGFIIFFKILRVFPRSYL
jgi:hypothetical protein